MINRRRFIQTTATIGAAIFTPGQLYAQLELDSWKPVSKTWMNILLPADKFGPGGDCPEVWARLEKIMDEQHDVANWIRLGFKALQNIKPPKQDFELERLLKSNEPYASFLRFFQEILLDSYYGSAVGWSELGFKHPNQPAGYPIQK